MREVGGLSQQLHECSKTIYIRWLRVQQNNSHPKIIGEKEVSFPRSFEDPKDKKKKISDRVKTVTGRLSGLNIILLYAVLRSLFPSLMLFSKTALKALWW